MLIGIILFVCTILLAGLWYSQRGEQRKRNKEMYRIAARIENERQDAHKAGEDFDVIILWGDVMTILDSLQNASMHAEGVQGIQDLALLIDNRNLIVKKQGQHIEIEDIPHMQTLVDTFDSQIKLAAYLNPSAQISAHQGQEQVTSRNTYNPKKEVYLAFAKIISSNNIEICDELSLYFDTPDKYFDQYYFDLAQRGIKNLSDLPDIIVLIDALARQKKLVYQDWKTELYISLEMLDQIVGGELIKNNGFSNLVERAKISLIGLSILVEKQGDVIFECIKDSGYKLLNIDENTGSYALFLIPVKELEEIIKLSNSAEIKLRFVDKP